MPVRALQHPGGGPGTLGRPGPAPRECQQEQCSGSISRQAFDDFIFALFAVEMIIKMVALGLFGQKCYLGDTWNRLDFFIVMAGYAPLPPKSRGWPRRPLDPWWQACLAKPGWATCSPWLC